jgi:hypothetical protein
VRKAAFVRCLGLAVGLLAGGAAAQESPDAGATDARPPAKPPRYAPSEEPAPGWATQVAARAPIPSRPLEAERAWCDVDQPVCIHVVGAVPRARVDEATRVARDTLALLHQQGLPPPLPDGGRGGSCSLDLYLTESGEAVGTFPEMETAIGRFDRAPVFGLLPSKVPGPACSFGAVVAQVTTSAVLRRFDVALHPTTARMIGNHVAQFTAPCRARDLDGIDIAQRTPYLAISHGPASALLAAYLDDVWGTGPVATVSAGLVATSSQWSEPTSWLLSNEPDFWDAFRGVMTDRGTSIGDALTDFAVQRAFLGDRNDGQHLRDGVWPGALGRVSFEWAIDYTSLPRRLAPLHPVEPTGASYVHVDMTGAAADAGLLFIAEWETSYVFEWAVVRLDAEGRELGRKTAGGVYGHDRVELTIENLDGAAALLVVGAALGHDDRQRGFDPDSGPPRPAGYTLTLHPR